ncbi:FMN-binding negative transcriptional regulator [Demequina sediminicola]|uniref:FMN-binding negative transcriptional regulator n=1 Tax=Demequina sediminicola TaxID=1095026 RepID=UPI0007834711|nr:FMN-binding negative transcriptional regulator [Demequina sediminicola]
MYVPHFNEMPPADVRDFVASIGSAQMVTVDDAGELHATQLPIVWRDDTVEAHLALKNPHVDAIGDGQQVLLIVTGPQAYVTPSWYQGKAEHGRVVPTWNYSTVQIRGTVTLRRDPAWLRGAVARLTDTHESAESVPWSLDDAPGRFIEGQLHGIVGVDIAVSRVVAKDKLSQNRADADRKAVAEGMSGRGGESVEVAARMRRDFA